jgi:hypothetical protein
MGDNVWRMLKFIDEPGNPDTIFFKFTRDGSYLPQHWGWSGVWGIADFSWSPPSIAKVLSDSGFYYFYFNDSDFTYWLERPAGSIFGGIFGRAASAGDHVKDAFRGKQRDEAFARAVEEGKQHFKQCSRCGKWVCPEHCWNAKKGLCEACAPDLAEEAAAAQAQAAKEQVWEKARQVDQVADVDMHAEQVALCPHCGKKAGGGKFCAECGKPLAAKTECPKCGAKIAAGAKFCNECGNKLA